MAPDLEQQIQECLESAFSPVTLTIRNDSAKHAGHAGNTGGGHFSVTIVSQTFAGHSLLERHRMVYEALGNLMKQIHALQVVAKTPD